MLHLIDGQLLSKVLLRSNVSEIKVVPREDPGSAPSKNISDHVSSLYGFEDNSQLAGNGILNSTDQNFSQKKIMMKPAPVENSSGRR